MAKNTRTHNSDDLSDPASDVIPTMVKYRKLLNITQLCSWMTKCPQCYMKSFDILYITWLPWMRIFMWTCGDTPLSKLSPGRTSCFILHKTNIQFVSTQLSIPSYFYKGLVCPSKHFRDTKYILVAYIQLKNWQPAPPHQNIQTCLMLSDPHPSFHFLIHFQNVFAWSV